MVTAGRNAQVRRTSMHERMQSLHAAVEHLGEASVIAHLANYSEEPM